MRVLRLIGGLDPAHGGPPQSAVNSIVAAQRAGAATTLTFPVETPRAPAVDQAVARLQRAGVCIVAFNPTPAISRRARSWGLNGAMAGWIRREARHYDIIHCHGAWQMATLLATIIKRPGQALVLTPHESLTGFDIERSSNAALRLLKTGLRRRYLRRFDGIVTASQLEAEDSLPAGFERPPLFEIIPHAVFDETAPSPVPQQNQRTAAPDFRLGILGRLHAKKNIDLAIRALSGLPGSVSLTIAGDGPERAPLQALAEKIGVADRVRWPGFVEGADKEAFFAAIDVLAMPSDYECFGVAAAEAMMRAVPVVVSPQTGIAELVRAEGGGLIAAPGSDAFARALRELAGQPGRLQTLSRQASAAAAKRLSFAAHGTALTTHYQQVLSGVTGRFPGERMAGGNMVKEILTVPPQNRARHP